MNRLNIFPNLIYENTMLLSVMSYDILILLSLYTSCSISEGTMLLSINEIRVVFGT